MSNDDQDIRYDLSLSVIYCITFSHLLNTRNRICYRIIFVRRGMIAPEICDDVKPGRRSQTWFLSNVNEGDVTARNSFIDWTVGTETDLAVLR